jgi:hypothetical protein
MSERQTLQYLTIISCLMFEERVVEIIKEKEISYGVFSSYPSFAGKVKEN